MPNPGDFALGGQSRLDGHSQLVLSIGQSRGAKLEVSIPFHAYRAQAYLYSDGRTTGFFPGPGQMLLKATVHREFVSTTFGAGNVYQLFGKRNFFKFAAAVPGIREAMGNWFFVRLGQTCPPGWVSACKKQQRGPECPAISALNALTKPDRKAEGFFISIQARIYFLCIS
jgi:hypothetical protein